MSESSVINMIGTTRKLLSKALCLDVNSKSEFEHLLSKNSSQEYKKEPCMPSCFSIKPQPELFDEDESSYDEIITEKTTTKFRQRFPNLSPKEVLIRVFRCSRLVHNKLSPGTVYMSENYLCFSSKHGFNLIAVPYVYIRKFVHNKCSIHFTFSNDLQLKLERIRSPIETLRLLQPKQEQKSLTILNDYKRLKITILTVGSRGDMQPFIALGVALKKKGHTIRLATHECYRKLVQDHQLEFFELPGDPRELIELCVKCGLWGLSFIREGLQKFGSWVDEVLLACWNACQGAETIIAAPSSLGGVHIAERLKVPFFSAFTMPFSRTSAFPHPFVGDAIKSPHLNYSSFILLEQVFYQPIRSHINNFRVKTLGIKPIGISEDGHLLISRQVPFLYSFSTTVVQRPADWADFIHITGYWFLEDVRSKAIDSEGSTYWTPPRDLVEFLEAEKEAPIYVGFGSIVCNDPKTLTNTVMSALRDSGLRAVVAKCWGFDPTEELDSSYSSRIHVITECPHEWLFPRVRAVVHHGGAGTTAIGLACGRPTLIVSFFGDQFFWGKRVAELGVGLNVPYHDLAKDSLVQMILQVVDDPFFLHSAQNIGKQIRKENGVDKTVELFHELLPLARS
eukprot:TRINITY_DN169_c0_g1_i1.p1 TRINITY_DN169_c0_g1~~TRINITY_DN169_c0_g1_i1.p1  ORF type:complete len:622 (+),score=51.40 TRINITY_DN169_c0_g1_i1:132-1997(+)